MINKWFLNLSAKVINNNGKAQGLKKYFFNPLTSFVPIKNLMKIYENYTANKKIESIKLNSIPYIKFKLCQNSLVFVLLFFYLCSETHISP